MIRTLSTLSGVVLAVALCSTTALAHGGSYQGPDGGATPGYAGPTGGVTPSPNPGPGPTPSGGGTTPSSGGCLGSGLAAHSAAAVASGAVDLAGKDADAIVRHLLPEVNAVTVTRAEPIRSLSPSEVATAIHAAAPRVSVRVLPDPHLALRTAREELGAEDLLCVAGSIYLAGIARRVFCDASSNERASVSRRGGDA